MKKYYSLILFCLVITSVFSQDNFSLNFAQTYSTFKFTDSEGKADSNMNSAIRYSYALNYNKIFSSGLYIRPELGYKNFGANSSINDQKLDWSLHYLDINIGGGYIVGAKKLKPFIGASFYFSSLFKAQQTIGADSYNMIKVNAIKTSDYGLNIHAGLIYSFTDAASVFFEYRYTTGLSQLELGSGQKLYNRAMSFNFGLAFNITKKTATKPDDGTHSYNSKDNASDKQTQPIVEKKDQVVEKPIVEKKDQVVEKKDQEKQMYKVDVDLLNVRSGPSSNYSLIIKIDKGEQVELIEKTNSDWWKIKYEGTIGYVYQSYLSK
jgi:hypothetical protein